MLVKTDSGLGHIMQPATMSKQDPCAKQCTYCMCDGVAGIIVLLLPEPVPDASHATTYAAHTVNTMHSVAPEAPLYLLPVCDPGDNTAEV